MAARWAFWLMNWERPIRWKMEWWTGCRNCKCPTVSFIREQEGSFALFRNVPRRKLFGSRNTRARRPRWNFPPTGLAQQKRQFLGASRKVALGRSLTQDLKRVSAQRRCSLVTTLLAGYSLLLHRLSGQPEVVIGLPMSSRSGDTGDRLGRALR